MPAQGITRLDVLEYITHGKTKVPPTTPGGSDTGESATDAEAGVGERGTATSRDPLAAYATDLTARARAGELDPLIGRDRGAPAHDGDPLPPPQEQSRCSSATRASARPRSPKAWRRACSTTTCPDILEGAEVFSLDTGALLAGTRFRGDFEERFKAVIHALSKRPMPILFIDEIHSTVGAGATTGGTMDLATLIKPILTTGQLRVVGSTTHEEFKHIEKDRALARRLQKIVIDEPTIQETVRILEGLRSRYEGHHRVRYSADALEAAAKLAARHLRDYKLPDSAIDVLDEAGAKTRLKRPRPERGAESPSESERGRGPASAEKRGPSDSMSPEVGGTPEPIEITAALIEEVVARMARIPAKQASSSDRDRLRSLEESLGRVVFGQEEAVAHRRAGHQARAGRAGTARSSGRAASSSPDRPASARRSSPNSSRCTSATSSCAST